MEPGIVKQLGILIWPCRNSWKERRPIFLRAVPPPSSGPAPLLLTLSKRAMEGQAQGKQSCWAKGGAAAWSPPGTPPASCSSALFRGGHYGSQETREQSRLIFRWFGASLSMLVVIWGLSGQQSDQKSTFPHLTS